MLCVSIMDYLAACAHMYTLLKYYTAKFRSAIAGKRCEGAAKAGAAAVAADAFSATCSERTVLTPRCQRASVGNIVMAIRFIKAEGKANIML